MRYRLAKPQVRRLINGQPVTDGRGRKYLASKDTADRLKEIDGMDIYVELDIYLDTEKGIEIFAKGMAED